MFPGLEFLNLSNNLLTCSKSISDLSPHKSHLGLRKLVLHGNKLDWSTLNHLCCSLPNLEEIHLSNNGLTDPDGSFRHNNLRQMFLTCNNIKSFEAGKSKFQQIFLGRKYPQFKFFFGSSCVCTYFFLCSAKPAWPKLPSLGTFEPWRKSPDLDLWIFWRPAKIVQLKFEHHQDSWLVWFG